MKSLCLFDLDGTLTDPKTGITKSIAYALNAFGIHVADLDALTHFIGPPLQDSFRAAYHFTPAEVERAISKYREYFSENGIFENAVYDGVTEALESLKENGATMAIATSKPTVFAQRIAEHFDLLQYFDLVAGSELDGTRSRKGDVIRYALGIVDPGRSKAAVMIGDREHDIVGAYENGMESIGVTWGYGSRAELEAARATWIVESPRALLQTIVQG